MKQPPTIPNTPPLLRNLRMFQFLWFPLPYIEDRTKRYGDICQTKRQNSPPSVTICNPQAIKEIFTASPENFDVGVQNKGLNFLVGDNSLLLLDGKEHQRQRRLLMPSFMGECLDDYSHQIVSITEKVTDRWQVGKPFRVRPFMQEITLRVILRVVFGLDEGERYDGLRKLLSSLLDGISSPLTSPLMFFPWLQKDWGSLSPWGRFLRLREQVKELLYDEIRERRNLIASGKASSRKDILTLLISAKDERGEGMTDEELHDELITLLFAGHDTTASALVWALYWIHHIPEVSDKLRFELDNLGADADLKEITKLPYLDAVISETLRIYPIALGTFSRILKSPMSIGGYDFEPGTSLMVSIYALHHREDLYPEPKQFRPERFLQRQYTSYEYIPFGGGSRRCLGAALAKLEMKLVIANILSRFQLALTSDRPIMPVRRGLTMAPPDSLKMVLKGNGE